MTILKLENNGTAKDILINGQLIAKATEAGLQAVKSLKALPSTEDDDVVVQSQLGRVLLATGSANNSASVDLIWEDTSFNHYEVIWEDLRTPTTSNSAIGITPSSDGGSTWPVTGTMNTILTGFGGNSSTASTGTVDVASSVNQPFVDILLINSTPTTGAFGSGGQGCWGKLTTVDNSFTRAFSQFAWFASPGKWSVSVGSHICLGGSLGVANAIRVKALSGNIAGGTFRVYGIR